MTKYKTPTIYILIHILLGFFSINNNYIVPIFISYQLIQLLLNIRIFLFSFEITKGNNINYTFYKIIQYIFGYCIGVLIC